MVSYQPSLTVNPAIYPPSLSNISLIFVAPLATLRFPLPKVPIVVDPWRELLVLAPASAMWRGRDVARLLVCWSLDGGGEGNCSRSVQPHHSYGKFSEAAWGNVGQISY